MKSIVVRKARPLDADELSALALRTSGLGETARGRMSGQIKANEITRNDVVTLIAADNAGHNAQLVGYLQLRMGAAPPCVKEPDAIQLWRIYVTSAYWTRSCAVVAARGCERGKLSWRERNVAGCASGQFTCSAFLPEIRL